MVDPPSHLERLAKQSAVTHPLCNRGDGADTVSIVSGTTRRIESIRKQTGPELNPGDRSKGARPMPIVIDPLRGLPRFGNRAGLCLCQSDPGKSR